MNKNLQSKPKDSVQFPGQYFISFLLTSILLMVFNLGAVSKTGTAAAQFLKIGVGPRATALGGAFTAISNDATALYWNPAGAAWMDRRQFSAAHTEWFADIDHEYLGIVLPFSGGNAFGLSFVALNAPEMEQTTIDQPEGTGIFFDVQDIAIGASYARMMTDRFSFGITAKYVQQTLFNETAKTFAFDFGGMLLTGFKDMRLGISINNFGGKLRMNGRDLIVSYDDAPVQTGNPLTSAKLETQSWPLPASFRIGLAMNIMGPGNTFVQRESQRLTLAVDGYNVNDAPENMNLGLEYGWNENFFLRAGYRINHDMESFSAGSGVRIPFQRWMIQADYALTNMDDLGYIQRVGIGLAF